LSDSASMSCIASVRICRFLPPDGCLAIALVKALLEPVR